MSALTILRSVSVVVMVSLSVAHGQNAPNANRPSAQQIDKSASKVSVLAEPQWDDISTRLAAIEKAVDKDTKGFDFASLMPAVFGLIGVLVGALINAWIQGKAMKQQMRLAKETSDSAKQLADDKAKQERELAENRAKLEIGNSFVQWQLKQLSELYGPLYALLGQSNAIYRQMNGVLSNSDNRRFRLTANSEDFDNKVFEIFVKDAGWTRFRTVLHLHEVYGKDYGVEDYFDEIIAIGGRMVKIIEEKAGYARPDQKELSSVFGNYLAHYSILKRLHSNLKLGVQSGDSAAAGAAHGVPMKVLESAVFPHKIQGLVDQGSAALNRELMEWRAKAAN